MLVEPEPAVDARGLFARTFCAQSFAAHGLASEFVQHSVSFNIQAGTLRGLHYQKTPHGEAKLVRCLRGRAFDVVVDLRAGTPAFGRWCSIELTAEARNAVFIPRGCAHGFQTLEAETELLYMMDAPYDPKGDAGIRWDDPRLAIAWPAAPAVISPRDQQLPWLG